MVKEVLAHLRLKVRLSLQEIMHINTWHSTWLLECSYYT